MKYLHLVPIKNSTVSANCSASYEERDDNETIIRCIDIRNNEKVFSYSMETGGRIEQLESMKVVGEITKERFEFLFIMYHKENR